MQLAPNTRLIHAISPHSGWIVSVAAGVLIAAVDNFAFAGEVSPIVIVLLIAIVTASLAFFWPEKKLFVTLAVWIWLPAAHGFKHTAGLPDTIQPNTYRSIAMLGTFTLMISLIGMGIGTALRRRISNLNSVDHEKG